MTTRRAILRRSGKIALISFRAGVAPGPYVSLRSQRACRVFFRSGDIIVKTVLLFHEEYDKLFKSYKEDISRYESEMKY